MKRRERRQGRILVHTGDGKGKSSSAFGVVFRAAGWGMRVCVIQFIKGKWQTGEERAASRFDNIEWHALGDGFTWDTNNPEQDRQTSRGIWALAKEKIASEDYDLVVLDLMLPELDGYDVTRILRKESNVPILMLTARADEIDRLAQFGVLAIVRGRIVAL